MQLCWNFSSLPYVHVLYINIVTTRRFGHNAVMLDLMVRSCMDIFSYSLNKIKSLADFQHCRNLVELYVRRNEIRDLSELCYLQDLPRLKRLLLAENPCVETAGAA